MIEIPNWVWYAVLACLVVFYRKVLILVFFVLLYGAVLGSAQMVSKLIRWIKP